MGFIFTMMMVYYAFKASEEFYKEKYAEFALMLFFNAIMVLIYSWLYGSYAVLMSQFVFSVLYVWCKNEPDR